MNKQYGEVRRISGWYLASTIIASLVLMIVSDRWQGIEKVNRGLSQVLSPVINSIGFPHSWILKSKLVVQNRHELLEENHGLKSQNMLLQAKIQKLQTLEAENLELRELLQTNERETESFSEARVIQIDTDPFSNKILINKGEEHGVKLGMAVIDSKGLVGVISSVKQHQSSVLLITDPSFAVPVQSVRSKERAIAAGSGTGSELRLNYVSATADFVEGDELVTSGLGGKFPAGYPVGVITSIQHDSSARFTLIGVSPKAKLGKVRHVLLVNVRDETTQIAMQGD